MTDEDHLNAIWGKVYNLNCPNGLNTDLNTLRVQGEDAFKYLSVSSKILFLNDMKIPNLFPLLYEPSFRYEDGTAEASHTMCISMFQRMLSSIGIQTRHEKTSTNDFILQSFFRTTRETKHPDEVSIYVFSDDLIGSLKDLSEKSQDQTESDSVKSRKDSTSGDWNYQSSEKLSERSSKVSEKDSKNEKIMRFFSTYSRRYVYDVQDKIESPESLSIPFYCLAENDFKKYLAIGNIQSGNNDIIQIALLKDFILDHWYLIDEVTALNIDVFFCVLANKCSDEDEDVPLYETFYDESSDPVNRKYYDDVVSAEKSKIGTETIKSLILPGINFLNNHNFKYLSDPDPSPGKKKLKLNIFDPFAEPVPELDPEEHYSYTELTEDHDEDDVQDDEFLDLRGVFDSDHEERLEPESFEMIRLRFQFMLYLIRTIMTVAFKEYTEKLKREFEYRGLKEIHQIWMLFSSWNVMYTEIDFKLVAAIINDIYRWNPGFNSCMISAFRKLRINHKYADLEHLGTIIETDELFPEPEELLSGTEKGLSDGTQRTGRDMTELRNWKKQSMIFEVSHIYFRHFGSLSAEEAQECRKMKTHRFRKNDKDENELILYRNFITEPDIDKRCTDFISEPKLFAVIGFGKYKIDSTFDCPSQRESRLTFDRSSSPEKSPEKSQEKSSVQSPEKSSVQSSEKSQEQIEKELKDFDDVKNMYEKLLVEFKNEKLNINEWNWSLHHPEESIFKIHGGRNKNKLILMILLVFLLIGCLIGIIVIAVKIYQMKSVQETSDGNHL